MAVIISFLSANNPQSPIEEYGLPDNIPIKEKKYDARYTNEAPLYYLTKMAEKDLKNDGRANEKIKYLFIVSKKVIREDKPFKVVNSEFLPATNGEVGEYTFFDYYKSFCNKIVENSCEVVSIPYDFQEINGEFTEIENKTIANNIYQKINGQINDNEKVYIDYTGGLRDINYLLVTLIQYLEIKNVTCESIVYSQLKPNGVRPIKYIYKINSIIQGAHDFIATGDITKLKEFFYDAEKYPAINELINKLDDFVKAVSIGQIAELENIKNEINKHINNFDYKVTADGETDLYRNIFTLLFPKIKGSLYIDGENNKFGYLEIVKWCIAHRYIQQAFTIYVEKFPEIYLGHGINVLIDDSEVIPTIGASHESTKFYKNFWDSLECSYEKILSEKIRRNFENKKKKFEEKGYTEVDAIKILDSIKNSFDEEINVKLKEFMAELENYENQKLEVKEKATEFVKEFSKIVEAKAADAQTAVNLTKFVRDTKKATTETREALLAAKEAVLVSKEVNEAAKFAAREEKEIAKNVSAKAERVLREAEALKVLPKVNLSKEDLNEIENIKSSVKYEKKFFYGFEFKENTKEAMLSTIINTKSPKFVYFLLGKGEWYNKKDSMEKKFVAIEKVKEKNNDLSYDCLINIMQAYLCAKIIRNHMNHAAAVDIENNLEAKVLFSVSKALLNDDKIELFDVFNYDVAKSIITKGVEITETIIKQNKTLITKEQYKELTGV